MERPSLLPIQFVWDGEVMRPAGKYWARRAAQRFTPGATYPLEPREERSTASHRAYFAALNEAHQNLPDDLAERFASADHLRRWALIKAGFRDERSITCASKAEALKVAAFMKPLDPYAVVVTRGNTVICFTAKSQSARAMDRKLFEESKEKVLDVVAALIGTTKDALQKAQAA